MLRRLQAEERAQAHPLQRWVSDIEIQGQEETAFAERMFVYHYRLFDRYHHPIVSLAVLGDERAT
ncbi:MAG: hypothetical protein MI924_36830 [Chloroflexales bacterium]|nr:hypothetical protein [Chloroflexales bacterium]